MPNGGTYYLYIEWNFGQSKKYVQFVMYYISDNLIFQHFEVLNTTMVQIEIIVKYMTWNPIITNGSN